MLTAGGGVTDTATWHLPAASSFRVVDMPGGEQAIEVTYVPEPSLTLREIELPCRRILCAPSPEPDVWVAESSLTASVPPRSPERQCERGTRYGQDRRRLRDGC